MLCEQENRQLGGAVIYRVLGELKVGPADGPIELPSGHALTLLAALLLNPNQMILKSTLIDAVWRGEEEVAEAQLHKRVKEVRDRLRQVNRQDDLRTHHGIGYALQVRTEDMDYLVFCDLVDQARRAAEDATAGDEVPYLRQALRLWRGSRPMANVPSAAFDTDIAAMMQRRKRAAVRLFDLELAYGHHDRVLDELMAIAVVYPTDRRLCEQLMVASYRCGHATDAMDAYRRHQESLGAETGGTPDRQLRTLHFGIAQNDETKIVAVETEIALRAGSPARSPSAPPRQLPPDVDLVGRDDMAAETTWLLSRPPDRRAPVIVLSGSPGVGKTALAVRSAHHAKDHYPDGQLYVECRRPSGERVETSEIVAQFLRAFGVVRVPETLAERLAEYRTRLAELRVLVILDDAVDEAQVRDLIPASPGCAVIVTTRRRLPDLPGAHHVAPLGRLGVQAATELFLRVLRAGNIVLPADSADVGRVVELCGGLPLALRIAGALRVHDDPRPTSELADHLARDAVEALEYGDLSVARAIGAGYAGLDPEARRLFLGLGCLQLPDFPAWMAEALMVDAGGDPRRALSSLAASFIAEPVGNEPAEDGGVHVEPRYRFHDLTREYAVRRARRDLDRRAGEAMAVRAYGALLTLARRAHRALYGGDYEVVHSAVANWDAPPRMLAMIDTAPLRWFEQEREAIRAAVDHCASIGLVQICWDLAVSSHEFYTVHGYFDDWYATHTVALKACRAAGDNRGEGILLACLGQPALVASIPAGEVSGPAQLARAAELLAGSGDSHGAAIALRTLANALRRRGQVKQPMALFDQALRGYAAAGDLVGQWQTLRFIGQTHLDLGQYEQALEKLDAAAVLAQELGGGRISAQTLYWLGQARLAAGDLTGAETAFGGVLSTYPHAADIGHAYAIHGLGDLELRRSALTDADRYLSEATQLAHSAADAVLEGRVALSQAAVWRARSSPVEELAVLESAEETFRGCGAVYLEIRAIAARADAELRLGRPEVARWTRDRLYRRYETEGIAKDDWLYDG